MGLYVCGLLLIIELDVDANCGETHEFMIDKQPQPLGDQRVPSFDLPCNL